MFRVPTEYVREKQDVIREKSIQNDEGISTTNMKDKRIWKYERLLNMENAWGEKKLLCVDLTERQAIQVDSSMVDKVIKNKKRGKLGH